MSDVIKEEELEESLRKKTRSELTLQSQPEERDWKDIYEKLTRLDYFKGTILKTSDTQLKSDKHEKLVLKCCIENGFVEFERTRDYLILEINGQKIQFEYEHIKNAIENKESVIPNSLVSIKDLTWKKPTKKKLIEIAKKKNLKTKGLTNNEELTNLINKNGGNNGKIILLKQKHRKFPNGKYIIHQIRGSQAHPDIILLNIDNNDISILPIECKSGKGKIMWNDNVPYSDYYFYLFTDIKSKKTVIFPGGHPTVMPESVKIYYLLHYIPLIKKHRDDKRMKELLGNIHNWDKYPRFNYICDYNFTKVDEKTKEIWKSELCRRYKLFIEFIPYKTIDIYPSSLSEEEKKEKLKLCKDLLDKTDEYITKLQKENTDLKKEITEKDKQIAEKDKQFAKLEKRFYEKDDIIAELKKQLLATENKELPYC